MLNLFSKSRAKALLIVTAVTFSLFASGCKDSSTTKGILASALDAVQKNNLIELQKTLQGKALSTYGNTDGLKLLREKLSPYSKLEISDEVLVKVEKGNQGEGQFGDVLRVYSDTIIGKSGTSKVRVASVDIQCKIKAYQSTERNCDEICFPDHNGGERCHHHCSTTHVIKTAQRCLIDDVAF